MKRMLATLAILGVLVVPVLAGAASERQLPPEAIWTPIPPTPPSVAVQQPRTVSTPQELSDVRSRESIVSEKTGYLGNWDPNVAAGD